VSRVRRSTTTSLARSHRCQLRRTGHDKNVQLFLAHDFPQVSAGVTPDQSIQFGHGILQGLDLDWTALGLDDEALDFLAEYLLRILQSFMIDPGRPARAGKALRDHLRRWIAPVLDSQVAGD
jgi:hypothetical protein